MPQLVSFIVWHLLRGYTDAQITALARARFGALPATVWTQAQTGAAQAMNTTALFLGSPLDTTLVNILPGTYDLTQPVLFRPVVTFGKGTGPVWTRTLDVYVDPGMTVGQVYADILTRAAALAAQSGAFVDAVDVVPPTI